MTIKIDNRESNQRIKSAVKYFKKMGYNPIVETLPVGDYVFHDRICFEFKTANDMIGSIKDGRVFRQARNMKQYEYSYVIVCGDVPSEINNQNKKKAYWRRKDNNGQFTVKSYLGAVARLNTYSHVLNVSNQSQAWVLMDLMVSKILMDNVDIKMIDTPQNGLINPIASFLSCIYVNDTQRLPKKSALKITDELGLNTLFDLLDVGYDDLIGIRGIGEKAATAVMNAIGEKS